MKKFSFTFRKKGSKTKRPATIFAKDTREARYAASADTRFKNCVLTGFAEQALTYQDYEDAAVKLISDWLDKLGDTETKVSVYCWSDLVHGVRVSEVSFTRATPNGGMVGSSFMACDSMLVPGLLERWLIDHFDCGEDDDTAIFAYHLRRAIFTKRQVKKLEAALVRQTKPLS